MIKSIAPEKLKEKGLKVTPQRVAVLEALSRVNHHPTAEDIIGYVKKHNPNIGTGTIYNVLDTFVDKKIICKVKTDSGVMRYDAVTANHHHLYSADSCRIEDYEDENLSNFLLNYFNRNKIDGFEIEDIKLQIIGKFRNFKSKNIKQ